MSAESTPDHPDPFAAAPSAADDSIERGGSDAAPAADHSAPAASGRAWPPRPQGLALAAGLAVALALLATAVAGFLWWQYRQFYVALHTTDTELADALERVRANDRRGSDQLAALEASVAAERERAAALADRLEELPGRVAELDRRVGELPARVAALERAADVAQGGSLDARATWLRAEAEYYLSVANSELELGGRFDNALAALELADDRLRTLADPALGRVREQIAAELLALRSVAVPDVDGLVFKLGQLAARADELPLRAAAPSDFDAEPESLDDAEPGLGRLLLGIRQALAGIVKVERAEQPPARGLSAERRALARRELVVELELARVAALRGEPRAFDTSVEAALTLLEQDFDGSAPPVQAAARLLRDLLAVDIAPERPDISRSLALLRSASAGDE